MIPMVLGAESHPSPVIWQRQAAGWFVIGAGLALVSCSAPLTERAQDDPSVITQERRVSPEIERGPMSAGSKPQPIADELLITFRPDTPEARRQAIHEAAGTQLLRRMLNGRIAHVKLRDGQTLAAALATYEKFAEVEAAESNHSMEILEHEGPAR